MVLNTKQMKNKKLQDGIILNANLLEKQVLKAIQLLKINLLLHKIQQLPK